MSAHPLLRYELKSGGTGKGIPAERLDEIFHEFYQLDNPERDRRNGLGLGLAIVKRPAKLLNYRVALRSAMGKGCALVHENGIRVVGTLGSAPRVHFTRRQDFRLGLNDKSGSDSDHICRSW